MIMIKNGKLQLEGRTDEIVDRFRFAEFFTENGTAFGKREGLIILKRAQNRWRALIDQKCSVHDWLQIRGAKEISLTRVTLEDLFVALAKKGGGEMNPNYFRRIKATMVVLEFICLSCLILGVSSATEKNLAYGAFYPLS